MCSFGKIHTPLPPQMVNGNCAVPRGRFQKPKLLKEKYELKQTWNFHRGGKWGERDGGQTRETLCNNAMNKLSKVTNSHLIPFQYLAFQLRTYKSFPLEMRLQQSRMGGAQSWCSPHFLHIAEDKAWHMDPGLCPDEQKQCSLCLN